MNPLYILNATMFVVVIIFMSTYGLLSKNLKARRVFEMINTYSAFSFFMMILWLTHKEEMDLRPLGNTMIMISAICLMAGTVFSTLHIGQSGVVLGWNTALVSGMIIYNVNTRFYLEDVSLGGTLIITGLLLLGISTYQRFDKKKNGYD